MNNKSLPESSSVTIGYFPLAGNCGTFRLLNVDEIHLPLGEFFDDLNTESLRGKVIISAAVIESLLRQILQTYFASCQNRPSLARKGLPSTAARQAELCIALGLLSEHEFQSILIIQEVRNKFAHVARKAFDDDDIALLVDRLDFAEQSPRVLEIPRCDLFLSNALNIIFEIFDRPRQLQNALKGRGSLTIVRTMVAI